MSNTTPCSTQWPRVYVESPYSGDIATNVQYAIAAMRDCLARDEAPFLSHLLYTQAPDAGFVADDDANTVHIGREAAMRAGWAFRHACSKTVVYTDRGVSDGMKAGVEHAQQLGHAVEYRTLPGWTSAGTQ